jgi:predicted nucleic acid-binding protein
MQRRVYRVYVDTSVFGGVHDDVFRDASNGFLDRASRGEFKLCISPIVIREIATAPPAVIEVLQHHLAGAETIAITPAALHLRQGYLAAKVVPLKSRDDALHMALATVAGCDAVVSWNFKHLVNFERIKLFSAINLLNGYNPVSVHSPLEMLK